MFESQSKRALVSLGFDVIRIDSNSNVIRVLSMALVCSPSSVQPPKPQKTQLVESNRMESNLIERGLTALSESEHPASRGGILPEERPAFAVEVRRPLRAFVHRFTSPNKDGHTPAYSIDEKSSKEQDCCSTFRVHGLEFMVES